MADGHPGLVAGEREDALTFLSAHPSLMTIVLGLSNIDNCCSTQLGFASVMAFVMPILLPLQTLAIVGKENKVRGIHAPRQLRTGMPIMMVIDVVSRLALSAGHGLGHRDRVGHSSVHRDGPDTEPDVRSHLDQVCAQPHPSTRGRESASR